MTEKELLAVLDLPENEQWRWAITNLADYDPEYKNDWRFPPKYCSKTIHSLADLAFRLRDEADEFDWQYGMERVFQHCFPDRWGIPEDIYGWFASTAKPTHFIIAALIAKEHHGSEVLL